ncbi:LLM class flavin-dependent oxidoreductase [Acrocarpospora macrocephala]|uniref:Monooxygenase n=1 Tax=Acrocarpospora macrocephala TaxID=150177 RepID=A0A5M3WID6_9ACTN|nr:LLM class flavin-dependent oxidoreductase [Acrocarpospora macrocephala]GES07999.1 monooxygenase [Acrocarpospora macrocephala]
MKFALFQSPHTPPERTPREVYDWVVGQAVVADQAGLTEYWVGEHATVAWEPVPNPEIILAAAAARTERIKLCPGAHLLPYHHPASLAVQVSWLTHLAEGRYILGVGAGAYPSDAALRGITDMRGNHEMVVEALAIMEKVWAAEPFHHEGRFWKAGYPQTKEGQLPLRDVRPYGGKVEIAMAGTSSPSKSLAFAGSRGYIPLSVFSGNERVAQHWATFSEAAEAAGHTVDRSMLRVQRDVFVAETDKEARKWAIEGGLGYAWSQILLPHFKRLGLLDGLVQGVADPLSVDLDYLADHVWIVGSPDTVAEKLAACLEESGGWGTTLVPGHNYAANPEPWNESLRLMVAEVAPRLRKLAPVAD